MWATDRGRTTGRIRKRHSPAFKAKGALQATRQEATIAELTREHQVHPVQISQWKKQLLDSVEHLFASGSSKRTPDLEALQGELYEQIGRLQMELAWVKRNWPLTSPRGGAGSSRIIRI